MHDVQGRESRDPVGGEHACSERQRESGVSDYDGQHARLDFHYRWAIASVVYEFLCDLRFVRRHGEAVG